MKYSLLNINILGLYFILLSLTSCREDAPRPLPKSNDKRTILIYAACDNNFSAESITTKNALLEAWDPYKMGNVLLFADNTYKKKPVLIKIVRIGNKNIADTIKEYNNENSASPLLLKEVIADMKKIAPSKVGYGMTFLSHATGWLPPGAYRDKERWSGHYRTRSIIGDQNDEMSFPDFVNAIPKNTFDFMVFDMCLLASVETVYSIKDKVPYIVASSAEVVSPGFVPTLKTHLGLLFKQTPRLVEFADAYFNYFNAKEGDWHSATVSVIKTGEIERLVGITKDILSNENPTPPIEALQSLDTQTPSLFFDYEDYMKQIATQEQYEKLKRQIKKVVIHKKCTGQMIKLKINSHCGLSTYVNQSELWSINQAYKNTEWYKITHNY